ncbi:Cd(II)/Pb(II)-responsive transcriptional regulator [Herbaspirillum sp. ST 5-3]|uniref:Cd(II)/Pb(II)-responsive transcriptional regulator n=1 Tax=Oxalobacteraceae TaxID=75682 RepID=UPI002493DF34|nr:Cd(II)/Pb(II)-responsive transcriptional regulator [Herbaspirillum sp. ST 5-3]
MQAALKIGELSKLTGCQVETIRFYEQEGLLPEPARSQSNYRLYGDAHVERLQFIRHCRSLDMTLDDVRTLLRLRDAPNESCGEVNAMLDRHIEQVSRRIAELKALQQQLKTLRRQCQTGHVVKDCGILQGLTHAGTCQSGCQMAPR